MKKNVSPSDHAATWRDHLKATPQYLLPHFLLSNLMYRITRIRVKWWKNWFISWFINQYKVDMSEALNSNPQTYACFNDFFTRPLKPQARPIASSTDALICPVDGTISQVGDIQTNRIFQAKGRDYNLSELLGGEHEWADLFQNGQFATIYLSPKDYHRIHMPIKGQLTQMSLVPGRLFSVSPATTRSVPKLFARNERVINYFYTDIGPVAVILVGAIFVAGIETVWHGQITPPHGTKSHHWLYETPGNEKIIKDKQKLISLDRGDELGRFNMGSTVILLFSKDQVKWTEIAMPGTPVKMGQPLATILQK